tara:strand:- start:42 stop:542 length:501 start_codon:yes stop_codon:yes gene_type:complete
MVLPALVTAARLIVRSRPAQKIIKKYGKETYTKAKEWLKTKSGKELKKDVLDKNKFINSPEKKVTAKITKKAEKFLKEQKSDDMFDGIDYSVRKGKLTLPNNRSLVDNFKNSYEGIRKSDFYNDSRSIPTSLSGMKLKFKPGLKNGGLVVRGQGAVMRSKKFKGVF